MFKARNNNKWVKEVKNPPIKIFFNSEVNVLSDFHVYLGTCLISFTQCKSKVFIKTIPVAGVFSILMGWQEAKPGPLS